MSPAYAPRRKDSRVVGGPGTALLSRQAPSDASDIFSLEEVCSP
jgi:hypothetical protein